MGFSFTNIQVRYAPSLGTDFADVMAAQIAHDRGWRLIDAPERADAITAICHPEGAAWVTIVSDAFDADVAQQMALAQELSAQYDTAALAISCCDSDYLMMNWLDVNRSHDLFASTGSAAAAGLTGMRRSNFAAWKKVLPDAEAFKGVMRRRHILAEACMEELADMLALPVQQGQACIDLAAELPGVKLYCYAAAEGSSEPPRFVPGVCSTLQCNGENYADFHNAGGDTRGVAMLLAGEDLISGALTVEEARFGFINHQGASVHIPVQFERRAFPDGVVRLRADMPEHRVRGVPEGLPPRKHQWLTFERGIFLIFTLKARDPLRRDYAPITVYMIPSRHWAGQGAKVMEARMDGME